MTCCLTCTRLRVRCGARGGSDAAACSGTRQLCAALWHGQQRRRGRPVHRHYRAQRGVWRAVIAQCLHRAACAPIPLLRSGRGVSEVPQAAAEHVGAIPVHRGGQGPHPRALPRVAAARRARGAAHRWLPHSWPGRPQHWRGALRSSRRVRFNRSRAERSLRRWASARARSRSTRPQQALTPRCACRCAWTWAPTTRSFGTFRLTLG